MMVKNQGLCFGYKVTHNNIGYHTLALPSTCLLASLVSFSVLFFSPLCSLSTHLSLTHPLSHLHWLLFLHTLCFFIILHLYTLPLCILTLLKRSLLLSLLLSLSISVISLSLSLYPSQSVFILICLPLSLSLPPSLTSLASLFLLTILIHFAHYRKHPSFLL